MNFSIIKRGKYLLEVCDPCEAEEFKCESLLQARQILIHSKLIYGVLNIDSLFRHHLHQQQHVLTDIPAMEEFAFN